MLYVTIRKNLGFTQSAFAKALSVSTRSVSRWETGEAQPTSLAKAALAKKLNGYASQAFPDKVWSEYLHLQQAASTAVGYQVGKTLPRVTSSNRTKKAESIKCVDCGGKAVQYDHRDYFKQLEVEPVCMACNSQRGVALNTFTDHPEHWKAFDWSEAPKTGRWAYKKK